MIKTRFNRSDTGSKNYLFSFIFRIKEDITGEN